MLTQRPVVLVGAFLNLLSAVLFISGALAAWVIGTVSAGSGPLSLSIEVNMSLLNFWLTGASATSNSNNPVISASGNMPGLQAGAAMLLLGFIAGLLATCAGCANALAKKGGLIPVGALTMAAFFFGFIGTVVGGVKATQTANYYGQQNAAAGGFPWSFGPACGAAIAGCVFSLFALIAAAVSTNLPATAEKKQPVSVTNVLNVQQHV